MELSGEFTKKNKLGITRIAATILVMTALYRFGDGSSSLLAQDDLIEICEPSSGDIIDPVDQFVTGTEVPNLPIRVGSEVNWDELDYSVVRNEYDPNKFNILVFTSGYENPDEANSIIYGITETIWSKLQGVDINLVYFPTTQIDFPVNTVGRMGLVDEAYFNKLNDEFYNNLGFHFDSSLMVVNTDEAIGSGYKNAVIGGYQDDAGSVGAHEVVHGIFSPSIPSISDEYFRFYPNRLQEHTAFFLDPDDVQDPFLAAALASGLYDTYLTNFVCFGEAVSAIDDSENIMGNLSTSPNSYQIARMNAAIEEIVENRPG